MEYEWAKSTLRLEQLFWIGLDLPESLLIYKVTYIVKEDKRKKS